MKYRLKDLDTVLLQSIQISQNTEYYGKVLAVACIKIFTIVIRALICGCLIVMLCNRGHTTDTVTDSTVVITHLAIGHALTCSYYE